MGCVVREAESGRAALTMLEQETRCDLMIVDLVMPGLSGLVTLRLARSSRPELRVLLTSGYADLSRFGDNFRDHPPFKSHSRSKVRRAG
jgi:YesN/AraC family two-component response regulator